MSEESTTTSSTAPEELAGKTWSPKDLTTRTQVTVCVGGGCITMCVQTEQLALVDETV